MEQPKTVLIVEDEKNIVDILRFNLQREGYQTAEAYDGEEGLEKARTADPDLILLDVMLPKMNGFDVCRQLREAGSSVPVIILTSPFPCGNCWPGSQPIFAGPLWRQQLRRLPLPALCP